MPTDGAVVRRCAALGIVLPKRGSIAHCRLADDQGSDRVRRGGGRMQIGVRSARSGAVKQAQYLTINHTGALVLTGAGPSS